MIREAIVKLVNKENLTYEMAEGAMDEIMGGKADPIQITWIFSVAAAGSFQGSLLAMVHSDIASILRWLQ